MEGVNKLRQRFSESTKQVIDHAQELHSLVAKVENLAEDTVVHVEEEIEQLKFIDLIINSLIEYRKQSEVRQGKLAESAELVVGLQIDTVQLEKDFLQFRQNYNTTAAMGMAYASQDYIIAMLLESDERINWVLDKIGDDKIIDYLGGNSEQDNQS